MAQQHDRVYIRNETKSDTFVNTQVIVITPSVAVGNVLKTNNSGTTTVTNLLGGSDTQQSCSAL
jgi:hypothetical protein